MTWPAGDEDEKTVLELPTERGMQQRNMAEFINAAKRKDSSGISTTVEDAFASTTSVQLAMIAYETGSIVKWDNQAKTITDNPEAAALLKREYRGQWQHPG